MIGVTYVHSSSLSVLYLDIIRLPSCSRLNPDLLYHIVYKKVITLLQWSLTLLLH